MSKTDNLVEPYIPTPIYYEEADRLEYVAEDTTCYYMRHDANFGLICSESDDRVIGVEVYAPMRAFADLTARLEAAEAKSLRLEQELAEVRVSEAELEQACRDLDLQIEDLKDQLDEARSPLTDRGGEV